MSYERLWARLLESLDELGTAQEIGPGRIEVELERPDASAPVVEIHMTPSQWDHIVTVMWADFDSAVNEVRQSLLALGENERYLVYWQYELVPSATPDPPADPEAERLAQLARESPGVFGRWMANPDNGSP